MLPIRPVALAAALVISGTLTAAHTSAAHVTNWRYDRTVVPAGASTSYQFDADQHLAPGDAVQFCFQVRGRRQAIAAYAEDGDGNTLGQTVYANAACSWQRIPDDGTLYVYLDNSSAYFLSRSLVIRYRYMR